MGTTSLSCPSLPPSTCLPYPSVPYSMRYGFIWPRDRRCWRLRRRFGQKARSCPWPCSRNPGLRGKSILSLDHDHGGTTRAGGHAHGRHLGEPVGQRVGYQIRFDRKISKHDTALRWSPRASLTRRLQQDAALEDVGLVIFDEFHERSLHADLALAAVSGSLPAARGSSPAGDVRHPGYRTHCPTPRRAPVITAKGKMFAVTTEYIERPTRGPLAEVVCSAVRVVWPTSGRHARFPAGQPGDPRHAPTARKSSPALPID